MSASKVKLGLAVFAVLFVALPICFVMYYGGVNHYEELDKIAQNYKAVPSEDRLRDLLNYPSDGACAYYHLALVGEAFSMNPRMFRAVSQDMKTDSERWHIHQLASLRDRVFEYFPERKPSKFDEQIESNQSWLASHE
ncbi:MAG: hypothetical protein KJO79_05170 [Verrucomicrobiae bacterium]|nr:hypothetical protein [Verrucomicrobiae bacterium]NNJ86549.1 hypothetical protein [Akkermansiaceae bacterium]